MRKVGLLLILLVAFAGTVIFFGWQMRREPLSPAAAETPSTNQLPALTEPTVTIIDPVRGPQDAPVTIVEFGDYLCEFCKQIEPVVEKVLAAYPASVRLVWKDFPNDNFHPGATRAAEAARCAGREGKYWNYHDLLMNRASFGLIPYTDLAAAADLNTITFDECFASGSMKPIVEYSSREAQALGLSGVPYFFINDVPFEGTTFAEFQTAIEKIIKASS